MNSPQGGQGSSIRQQTWSEAVLDSTSEPAGINDNNLGVVNTSSQ